jgi:protein-S-isoprenylcysteine O-methyltransferase Ste14
MIAENLFRFAGLALMVAMFSISVYFRRKANISGGEDDYDSKEESPLVLRVRGLGALLGYGSILVYLINPAWMNWAQVELAENVRWAGAALALLMTPLLYWMFRSLGKNITPTVSIREEHDFVQDGPYRYIRHPLYTFASIFFVGMALLTAMPLSLLGLVVAMSALVARTEQEEQKLVERFGNPYSDYMQRTGRFFPKLSV